MNPDEHLEHLRNIADSIILGESLPDVDRDFITQELNNITTGKDP